MDTIAYKMSIKWSQCVYPICQKNCTSENDLGKWDIPYLVKGDTPYDQI